MIKIIYNKPVVGVEQFFWAEAWMSLNELLQ